MNLTCKTCFYWVKASAKQIALDEICAPTDPDTFDPLPVEFEVRVCTSPKLTKFKRPAVADGAGVIDGEDYLAELLTAEDFGCVSHDALSA